MDEVLSRLQTLTPDQLREEMTQLGLKCGPVTATTRGIFEKKLARTILESLAGGDTKSEVDGGDMCSSAAILSDQSQSLDGGCGTKSVEKVEDEGAGDRTLEDASPQASSDPSSPSSPSLFYGVLLPLDDPTLNDGSHYVYSDQKKALKAVMKMKGARFKAFSSREDAENFAKGLCDVSPKRDKSQPTSPSETSANLEMANLEKANDFRSPRTQDLTAKLRKAVEKGEEEAFRKLVWENPRYLIGSGDNPTIVQEGCRYNVLHIAAKENQVRMANLILDTLENPEFMRLMYPDDREDMLWNRIDYVVDLYLNTPDKGSNETPLHFACKFGCSDVVNVLCSHPAIEKNCRNKYGQKPSSVICERKNKSKEVKQKISEYLEDRFFVPLLRATDNTLDPVIGVPWAPGASKHTNSAPNDDPMKPSMTLRAFVGPLNPAKAEEFHRLWKTPPRDRARYFHHILKSDPDRGAERVGRELAHELGFPWAEYWDFLNCFTDFSADDGLGMLEDYLKNTVHLKAESEKSWTMKSPESLTGHEKKHFGKFSKEKQDMSSETSVDSWSEENILDSVRRRTTPVCDLLEEFERVSFERGSGDKAENTLDSGLGCPALSGSAGAERLVLAETSSLRRLEWDQSREGDSSAEEYYTADEESENECEEDGVPGRDLPNRGVLSSSWSSSSSYKSTGSLHEDTRADLGQTVFLAGKSPSKLDNEVLLAITGVCTDEQLYPSITKWKNTVLSYSEAERQRWPSVTVVNRHLENQTSTPIRLTRCWMTGSPSFLRLKMVVPGQEAENSTPEKRNTQC